MTTKARATVEDLYRVPENAKAELVNGELVLMSPTGGRPGYAGDEIFASLRAYCRRRIRGWAFGDNKAFRVNLPHRSSFSPNAAFYVGPPPTMRFYEGAPIFAVEVRSEGDYGAPAEDGLVAKRADYFAAGTLGVWDVDLLSDDVVRAYRADVPNSPIIFRAEEIADAEPTVPGWRMPVDTLFVPNP